MARKKEPKFKHNKGKHFGLVEDNIEDIVDVPFVCSDPVFVDEILKAGAGKGNSGGGKKIKIFPKVTLISPAPNTQFQEGDSIVLSADASDQDGSIYSVSFYQNGNLISSDNTTPFSITWSNVQAGVYDLTAVAVDDANLKTTSSPVRVTVVGMENPNPTPSQSPSVSAAQPTPNPSVSLSLTPEPTPQTTSLPNQTEVSLRTPIPMQQGNSECAAFSAMYGLSINQYYKSNATTYSTSVNIFSPKYIYNLFINYLISVDGSFYGDPSTYYYCDFGSNVMRNLDLVKANGVCRFDVMPFTPFEKNSCYEIPNSQQRLDGEQFKNFTYSGVLNSDIEAIKAIIRNNKAIMFSAVVDNSFINASPGFIWKTRTSGAAGHAMTIVGYDDTKNAFKILNSWGTKWCEGGFGWIDYGFFPTITSNWCFFID